MGDICKYNVVMGDIKAQILGDIHVNIQLLWVT
jgi:hypothetical protein